MTSQTENIGTMKLLTKVARGMDLPAGQPSSPIRGSAPLLDDGYFEEELIYPASSASQSEDAARVKEIAVEGERPGSKKMQTSQSSLDTAALSNDRQKSSQIKSTLLDEPSASGFSESHDSLEDDSEIPGTSENPAEDAASDIEVASSDQPPSKPVLPYHYEEESTGRTAQMQDLDDSQPGPNNHGAFNESQLSETRWNYLSAEDFKDHTQRQVSRMLRPIFQTSAGDDRKKPDMAVKNEKQITQHPQPSADRRNLPTETSQLSDQPESAVQIPQEIPEKMGESQIPVSTEKVLNQLNDVLPKDRKPRALSKGPPVPKTFAPLVAKDKLQPTKQYVPGVRQVKAPAKAVKSVQNHLVSPAVPQDDAKKKAGEVTIGKINIHVRGSRQTEEEWPAAPQYSAHKITEDWEWSCHYGK